MKPYQERVVIEKKELDSKMRRLQTFRETDTYWELSPNERLRLVQQSHAMDTYAHILNERIKAFE